MIIGNGVDKRIDSFFLSFFTVLVFGRMHGVERSKWFDLYAVGWVAYVFLTVHSFWEELKCLFSSNC